LFQVDVEADTQGWAHLRWSKRDQRRDWMKLSEGCYLLRSNVTDWSGEELWRAYIQLTEAEEAFRLHKSDLVMRPVWHQKEHRVQERRILIKAEVVRAEGKAPKDNPRFVITNMKQSPQWLYEEVYCQRGEIENRIKELYAMEIDRTSCSRFWANQFRVLLTAAAYVLMQELRLCAAGTDCARAQVWTLRERFLKLGARVMVSVRRIVMHLPQSFPFLATFRHMALELEASPG
jgi:hypothetical protein